MDVRQVIRGHRVATIAMAVASTIGGLAEAAFLVLAARLALAVSKGETVVALLGGHRVANGTGVAVALCLVAVRFALAALANQWSADMAVVITADLRRDLATAFFGASWSKQHGDRVGRLQELMTNYTVGGANLVIGFSSALTAAFGLAAMLALAIAVNPVGALAVIAAVAVLGLALRPVRARVEQRSKETSSSGMAFATGLGEVANLGLELQVFGVQDEIGGRVDELIDAGRVSNRRLVVLRGLVPHLYTALAFLALVVALALASGSSASRVGSLGAVMLVMLRSLSYGQQFQVSAAVIRTTMPYLDELDGEIRDYRGAAVVDGTEPVGQLGELELRNVSFEYVEAQPVLIDVSVVFRPGEVVGIVGPSGSGKSTLVQLLLGLRQPSRGQVLAGGRPVASFTRREWVRTVTFVPQTPRLVRGTLADNIRFFRPGVTTDEVEQAARLARVHDDIAAMPEGYAREAGEAGGNLSGGQQQRICIARALVERPQLLVLDEPTSALDGRSEALIRQTLKELAGTMTIVIIAHRTSTLDVCDRILVLQHGRVVAFDTPERLQADSPAYREITQTTLRS
jgi:ABC-type multidrug transport system fused ATPase/permease subunit